MKFLCTLPLLLLVSTVSGQITKYPPQDDSNKESDLAAFVLRLKDAIASKDEEQLITFLHPFVRIDFDGGVGIEEFKAHWKPGTTDSELWPILKRITDLGGVFTKNKSEPFYRFVFPYIFAIEFDDSDLYFSAFVVTGTDVPLKSTTDSNAKTVTNLSYDVVLVDFEKSDTMNHWYYAKTIDGKFSGFIKDSFVYSPIDYRMFLTKENGKWMISGLVAGD